MSNCRGKVRIVWSSKHTQLTHPPAMRPDSPRLMESNSFGDEERRTRNCLAIVDQVEECLSELVSFTRTRAKRGYMSAFLTDLLGISALDRSQNVSVELKATADTHGRRICI